MPFQENRLTILLLVVIMSLIVSTYSQAPFHIQNGIIYDSKNRSVIFRGPNVVSKVPPYHPIMDHFDPQFSFSEKDMADSKKWGWNAIRLGMMWAGVEPKKNQYDENYIAKMVDLVTRAGRDHGIYTLVDFHQDLISEKFCGDGVPQWLIDELKLYRTFPFPMGKKIPLNQSGLPSWENCNRDSWGQDYFSYDVGDTFAQLYRNGTKLNRKFKDFWMKVAAAFKGNPYVIAFDLINEPFVGNAIRDLPLAIPSVAERLHLQHFYDQLAQQIYSVDPKARICFQPITFDEGVPVGFNHPPGGHRYANQSILCYHYYNPPALGYGTIDQRVRDAKRLGVPILLSEFFMAEQDVEYSESKLQSGLFWGYKSFGKDWGMSPRLMKAINNANKSGKPMTLGGAYNPDGTPNKDRLHQTSRPFLPYTAGTILSLNYDSTNYHFQVSYQAETDGVTQVWINREVWFGQKAIIRVIPESDVIVKPTENGWDVTYVGKQPRKVQIIVDKRLG